MNDFKLLVRLVVFLTVVCFVASDPIPQSSTTNDEKREVGGKPQVPPEAPKKSDATTDKSTGASEEGSSSSPSSCGGLKGFLHLCQEKKEDSPKQKRSLNEEDVEENGTDTEKKIEETDEDKEVEKRDVPSESDPSDETESKKEIEMTKRQIQEGEEGDEDEEDEESSSEDEVQTSIPALDKREVLNATPSETLTSDKPPAPLSSEYFLPIPQKRQEKESEEDDGSEDEVDDDTSDENDEGDKR